MNNNQEKKRRKVDPINQNDIEESRNNENLDNYSFGKNQNEDNKYYYKENEEGEIHDKTDTNQFDLNDDGKNLSKHFLIKNLSDQSLLLNKLKTLEENKLYVKNINENLTKTDFDNFFSNIIGYVDTRIILNSSGKSKKFAYIEFDTKQNALNFLDTLENSDVEKFKKFFINNNILYTCISDPQKNIYEQNKIFIKFINLVTQTDENIIHQIKKFLLSHSVPVLDIRLLGDADSKHGYIEVENNEDVIKCVEEIKRCNLGDGTTECIMNYSIPIIKKKIIPDMEKIKIKKEKDKQLKDEKRKEENSAIIVVKNLNYNTRKYKLEQFFQQIGEIENINLSKKTSEKNNKRNKGYAFITFKNKDDATAALILNDSILDGRNILISKFIDNIKDNRKEKKNNINYEHEDVLNEQGYPKNASTHVNFPKQWNMPTQKIKHTYHARQNFIEKKRINLKDENNHTNLNLEKRADEPSCPMTNDDFRKLFFK
ncbi:U4/U6 snRNA-associated-splicing factor, putative [Plasmodium chabaudi chabaudi]|uniref:U4/U6 snRNA-associated-splicing factor, putative n=1 Tax=Plasmodium chabaudi chabaudi TaxID=31271 RepID=A0A4V0K643_PLACU|nr:U4/U6 snRNA-associated-splicing factor, putative [Plasmodium chabaudi chabaudi]VTZ68429.1 U4/U6 snRNA-associated-splicing factor, putative [Plasmodium chabaudi chabaudi]|eukprot:XP_745719.1 U4/U6 snRNA-associated-splicing factor, putative [Plasmodium chabaudi chabaudi]